MPKKKATESKKTTKKAENKKATKKAEKEELGVLGQCTERVNKHYKRPILKRARDASNPFLLRRPTKILSFDIATGGGFPAGGPSQIAAPDGIGKNSLSHLTMRACQDIYGEEAKLAWIWTEIFLDKKHARINGVVIPSSDYEIQLEDVYRSKNGLPRLTKDQIKSRKVEIGEYIVGDEGSSAEKLQAAVELVRENQCQIITIDNVAAIVSDEREKTDLDDEPQQSAEARLITEFQKKLWHALGNSYDGKLNLTTVLLLNQVRANRNKRSSFDREWKVGGAHAIRHGKLIDVTLTKGNRIWVTPTGKETRKKGKNCRLVGKDVRWQIDKGKAGCHEGGSGEIPYSFSQGFNIYLDLIVTAKSHGIINLKTTKKGNKEQEFYFILDEAGKELEHGEGGLMELQERALLDNDFFNQIYDSTMRKAEVVYIHKL